MHLAGRPAGERPGLRRGERAGNRVRFPAESIVSSTASNDASRESGSAPRARISPLRYPVPRPSVSRPPDSASSVADLVRQPERVVVRQREHERHQLDRRGHRGAIGERDQRVRAALSPGRGPPDGRRGVVGERDPGVPVLLREPREACHERRGEHRRAARPGPRPRAGRRRSSSGGTRDLLAGPLKERDAGATRARLPGHDHPGHASRSQRGDGVPVLSPVGAVSCTDGSVYAAETSSSARAPRRRRAAARSLRPARRRPTSRPSAPW